MSNGTNGNTPKWIATIITAVSITGIAVWRHSAAVASIDRNSERIAEVQEDIERVEKKLSKVGDGVTQNTRALDRIEATVGSSTDVRRGN